MNFLSLYHAEVCIVFDSEFDLMYFLLCWDTSKIFSIMLRKCLIPCDLNKFLNTSSCYSNQHICLLHRMEIFSIKLIIVKHANVPR